MVSEYARKEEARIEALIVSGAVAQAIEACEHLAHYYDGQESNCDQAGEYAEGMRASRAADEWRNRARELRAQNP